MIIVLCAKSSRLNAIAGSDRIESVNLPKKRERESQQQRTNRMNKSC